jgi:hypothetical protein
MPKALCIAALAISILVVILFASDLLLGIANARSIAPFKGSNILLDVVFLICAAILGLMSFRTLKQQV